MDNIEDPLSQIKENDYVRLGFTKSRNLVSLQHQVVKVHKVDGNYAIVEFVSPLVSTLAYTIEIYIPDWSFTKPSEEYVKELIGDEWPDEIVS
jgi:hypothetical protein